MLTPSPPTHPPPPAKTKEKQALWLRWLGLPPKVKVASENEGEVFGEPDGNIRGGQGASGRSTLNGEHGTM